MRGFVGFVMIELSADGALELALATVSALVGERIQATPRGRRVLRMGKEEQNHGAVMV